MAKKLKEVPRMDEDEIKEVATALVQDKLFTSFHCPSDMWMSVFMVLGLGGLQGVDPDSIGCIYEYMSKANEMSVNGYPTFFSCRFIHKDDWSTIVERYTKAKEAMETAAAGGTPNDT